MSIVKQMGEHIREQICKYTADVFATLGTYINHDNIWHDFAEVRPGFFKSTFYISGLDNVKRKDFNLLANKIKESFAELKEFKVKFKRPEKEVRFYIEVNNNTPNDI